MNQKHLSAALRNVDRRLGDCFDIDETDELEPAQITEETWNLAFDGAVYAGATMEEARKIADYVRKTY